MRFGVCYYPEHWPSERWAHDAAWLKQLGVDVVRMAEFAWGRIEPAPGRLDFGWLDRAIELFTGEGFDIVLGTPTAAPPTWLSDAEPDALPVDREGRRRRRGGRRHYCPNSAAYRAHTVRIVTAMAERYGAHDRVIGWQVDNEFGDHDTARCYCPRCDERFREWLSARYGTVHALNEAWGTVFWSAQVDAFERVSAPILGLASPNPSHVLDYWRFSSEAIGAYERLQIDVLRERLPPDRWVTHNLLGLSPDLDAFALASPLDLAAWDSYPTGPRERWHAALYGDEAPDATYAFDAGDPTITGFAHDLTFGLLAQPFWVMEQQMGHINWAAENTLVRAETARLWAWHAVASGADAVVYFRERAAASAQEQYHSGLLHHDGTPDVGFRAAERLNAERDRLDALAREPPRADAALLFSYEDLWALALQPHHAGYSYLRALFGWYRALQRLGIPVAVVPHDRDLERYALVLGPALHLGDCALADRLSAYAQGGGTLVLGPRSGVKTSSNQITTEPLPGVFKTLIGATVSDWGALPTGAAAAVASPLEGLGGPARTWAEALLPDDAGVLASWADGPYRGAAALTARQAGAGQALYCGWQPGHAQTTALLAHIAERRGIERLADLPAGVVACRRGERVVLLNFTERPLRVAIDGQPIDVAPLDVVMR